MARPGIENRVLRVASFPDLAKYFKQLLTRLDNGSLTDYLLAGLTTDSLPFRAVAVWIAGFADAPSIVKASRFEQHSGVRRLAIKRFARCLRSEKQMKAVVDAVGGISGLLELFAELSVHDLQAFCCFLGRTCTWNVAKESRQRLLTELVEGLLSDSNPEKRTFIKFYAKIVPGCTVDFVRSWEANNHLPRAGGRWMDHAHHQHTRERCLRHLEDENGKNFKIKYFENVLHELPPTPAGKYMSQSMAFSLELLNFLGEHPEIKMNADQINDDIFSPLIRRLNKRRAPHHVKARALQCVVKALKTRIEGGGIVDMNQHGPLRNAVACWGCDTSAYHQLLLDTLRLVPEKQKHVALDRVGTLLSLVKISLRYQLLTLAVKHMAPLAKDIESDDELSELGPWPVNVLSSLSSEESFSLLQRLVRLRLKDSWQGTIFTSLHPEHAAPLLQELSSLRPAGDFLEWNSLRMLANPIFSIAHNQELAVLQLYTSPSSAKRDEGWNAVIDERKKQASRERDAEERGTWVRSAVLCSVASGSLHCCRETILWARRFKRDPLVSMRLYKSDTILTEAMIELLVGVPSDQDLAKSPVDAITEDVKRGNELIMLLLETAFQAIAEPSFQCYHWSGVLGLWNNVVKHRLARSDSVQDALSLSDDEMYNMLWRDTLETLLSAEKQCLLDEHKRLQAQDPEGLLAKTSFPYVKSFKPSQCKFLDELARRRNELWAKHRLSQDPNVLSIEAPFPSGLAFQDAQSFHCGPEYEGYAGCFPYLEARAESIVFGDARTLLSPCPSDLETRKAIRGFVDNYRSALGFYGRAGKDEKDRIARKEAALKHALGPLSEGRGMSAEMEVLFRSTNFMEWPAHLRPDKEFTLPPRPDPIIPDVEDPDEPMEWNPDPEPHLWKLEEKDLEPTCLDAMLQVRKDEREHGTVLLRIPRPNTTAVERYAFWDEPDLRPMRTIAPAGREGLLALGLLLINSKCCSNLRLFAKPFPSAEDARFPAVYLDEEFLERDGISEDDGFVILERLSKDAPLTLVAQLCEAMLANCGGVDKSKFETETLRLLKILVESDRPDLALDLVRKVVLERPDASAWHRHMMTPGLFDRLKSGQARGFVQEIASSIAEGLQLQAQRPPATAVQDAPGAMIKVTTVTALAQLLSRAKFVTGNETVDILTGLFRNARHPDIHVALIKSLTSILCETKHDSVKAQCMDALEQYAVPIASAMNERSPMSEEDWQKAEADVLVPEVNEPQAKSLQPVLGAIVDAYGSVASDNVPQMYHRLLLPILDRSAANNRRWTSLFLRKHKLYCRAEDLPPVPPKPHYLPKLVSKDVQDRGEEIFNIWSEAVLTNFCPPANLQEVTKTISNYKELSRSNGGKHWLSLWHNPGVSALSWTGTPLHRYLTTPNLGSTGTLPIRIIQKTVSEQLEIMLTDYDSRSSQLVHLLSELKRPQHKSQAWEEMWDENVRPLIEQLVSRIEGVRTPEWQRQSHRVPATLPDTFEMQLWLLTWPGWVNTFLDKPGHDENLEIFADELTAILTSLTESGKPYHLYFPKLKDAACSVNPADVVFLALHFGSDWKQLRLVDYLGIEIAEALMQKDVVAKKKDLTLQLGQMILSWRASADELVRMSGIRVASTLEGHRRDRMSKMGWFWDAWGRDNVL